MADSTILNLSAAAADTASTLEVVQGTGAGANKKQALAANIVSLLQSADYAAVKALLSLVLGTNVQAWDADLDAIAALTSAANKMPYSTGAQAWALADLTAFARTLLDDASAAVARVTLLVDSRTAHGDSDYTILATDKLVSTSAAFTAARTWTLPAANTVNAGQEIIVADEAGGVTSTNTLIVARTGADTIDGATTEVIQNAYGMRRFFSDGTSKWSFDKGVVRLAAVQTLTNKRIDPRVVTEADATSWTPAGDTSDISHQTNAQATGTLTVNAPSGTPTAGQPLTLRIKSTNVQTFSFNAIYRGGTDLALPTVSTAAKTDYYFFRYNSVDTKWDILGMARGL